MNPCTPAHPCHLPACEFCDPIGFLAHLRSGGAVPGDEDYMEPPELTRADLLRAQLIDTDGLDHLPDPEPLAGEDILFRDSLAWMVGKPGCGKSFVALDLAGCVATGQPWLGFQVAKGPVLYLVAEGVRGVKKRVRAWERAMRSRMTGVAFLPVAVQSSNAGEWDALTEVAAQIAPALIILDTQARVTVGVEENSNSEMGRFVERLEQLRRATAACVLVVHHIGRAGDTGRGATTMDGALSTVIKVEKDDALITLECTKNKDGDQWSKIHLRAVPAGDSLVLMIDTGEGAGRPAATAKWLNEWWDMFRDDSVSAAQLIRLGLTTESSFHRAKRALIDSGLMIRTGQGPRTTYRLSRPPLVA